MQRQNFLVFFALIFLFFIFYISIFSNFSNFFFIFLLRMGLKLAKTEFHSFLCSCIYSSIWSFTTQYIVIVFISQYVAKKTSICLVAKKSCKLFFFFHQVEFTLTQMLQSLFVHFDTNITIFFCSFW